MVPSSITTINSRAISLLACVVYCCTNKKFTLFIFAITFCETTFYFYLFDNFGMLVSILCINSSVAVKDLRSEDKDKVLYIDPPRAVAYLGGGGLAPGPPLV